ncbi:hypothetical protein ACWHAO_04595 [Streptomyces albidoflavus]
MLRSLYVTGRARGAYRRAAWRAFTRPLGATEVARTIRFYADDPAP